VTYINIGMSCKAWDSDTSGRKPLPFSERCRILAQECRTRALSFQNEKSRLQMLQLADDYERKALQAADIEASLRALQNESAPLIPDMRDMFATRPRA
jgi:hypothetical protein